MKTLDKAANRMGLVRMPGESDAELLYRIKLLYRGIDYDKRLPLLTFLNKLNLRSVKYLFSNVPNE